MNWIEELLDLYHKNENLAGLLEPKQPILLPCIIQRCLHSLRSPSMKMEIFYMQRLYRKKKGLRSFLPRIGLPAVPGKQKLHIPCVTA